MCHESVKRYSGFSLVTAIFLLVILASLGAFILTIAGVQQTSSALDVQGSRAYQAARSGIEWGTYQVLINTGGAFAAACNPGPTTQTLTGMGGTLSGFTTTVDCSTTTQNEGGVTVLIFQITSTAAQGTVATLDRVERQLQATLSR
ncbi:MAG TPA: hypothetical protein VHE58_01435 [Burkholderiales bacterium]|nr:hypothetical protein [Burkholderiales bacterium]